MPIPDAVAADTDYQEQQALAIRRQDAKTTEILRVCNALIKMQLQCGKQCFLCADLCAACKEWEALEER